MRMSDKEKELARETIRKDSTHPSYDGICRIPPRLRHHSMRCLPDRSVCDMRSDESATARAYAGVR